MPRAALAYFPSAPPTPLRAKRAPPAPLSSFRPISSCQRLEMQEQKNANSFLGGEWGGSTQRVRSRDHFSSLRGFFFFPFSHIKFVCGYNAPLFSHLLVLKNRCVKSVLAFSGFPKTHGIVIWNINISRMYLK